MSDHTFTMRRKRGTETFDMLHPLGREMATRAARLKGDTQLMHKVYHAAREGADAALRGRA